MPKREFIGYDSPFLPLLTSRLLEDREGLAGTLVIVPTGQSGRILRESLAAAATALLAPAVSTPGALLHLDDAAIAPPWIEKLAWMEALSSIPEADWEKHSNLFPIAPDPGDGSGEWALSIATEIVALRTTLQERLHNLFTASKFLASTPEAGRWESLARIETMAERQLAAWGFTSRTAALRAKPSLLDGYSNIILAGVTEMPQCLADALGEFPGSVTAIIAAPDWEKDHFSPLGLPLEAWASRELPSHAHTGIFANPAAQAGAALDAVSASGAASTEIALGTPDEQVGAALARTFTEHGWPAFHPAASQPMAALVRWLHAWKDWLAKPSSRHLAALLSLPESAAAISGKRAQKLLSLNKFRDDHPTVEPQEILHLTGRSEDPAKADLNPAVGSLLELRRSFLAADFPAAMTDHLRALAPQDGETVSRIGDFLTEAAPLFQQIRRSHTFWLQTLLSWLPASPAQPGADRVIDVQGWLELLFEPGAHLIICGMNEGFVPSRSGGEPWLSENIRAALGLSTDADRHARDAYLLHAMLMMRRENGSAHLICGKNGPGGETLLPSRLLLRVGREDLVTTVGNLFREIEPPEANLIWTRDFEWQTPAIELPERISVTALRDYLDCPFRFYLKHLVRMGVPEPDRREMNARDFGSITHLVVENWGNDPAARSLSDPAKLSACLDDLLADLIRLEFGTKPPLAIRIQAQSIRQRLEWFAAEQVKTLGEGWEIIDVERKFAIPSGAFLISGKIDRIDRHRETGRLRVIDYKTGKVGNTEAAHRQKIAARTRIPAHFPEGGPGFQETTDAKGKPAAFFWKNLQLPLYALAQGPEWAEPPIPAYIHLGKTEENVKITSWDGFSAEDLESAKSCADWITESVGKRIFWPPAEKVEYDDFATLSQNAPLEEAFSSPGS